MAFRLAGGEEKTLVLSFPEVTAEELLGKIIIPEIDGQGYETPFTMEFFMALRSLLPSFTKRRV